MVTDEGERVKWQQNICHTWVSLLVKCTIHPCFNTFDPFLLVCFTDTTIRWSGMLLLIVGVSWGNSLSGDEGLVGSKSSWLLRLANSISLSFSLNSCSFGMSFERSISDKLSEMAPESEDPRDPAAWKILRCIFSWIMIILIYLEFKGFKTL